ncbi:hypothetical protein BDV33DRAFT_231046 [Aspergillus novoparasiticus]|uniref:Fe2OG dioxygenase domain-containing protein n=1 Tax=Aspergillus novoparasiticus TaxID=986946 RepID=A0A5N6F7R3_9EURO|nr:hypothetical protein BDV33DRAFT_231046 [Aspergillus novoparasiticus]
MLLGHPNFKTQHPHQDPVTTATTPSGWPSHKESHSINKLPQSLIDSARVAKKEVSDPNKHPNSQPLKRVTTMKEIGLEGHGTSSVAASEPRSLFTPEAIKQIRAEVISEPVLADCQYSSTFAKNMVRGMGRAQAPFTCDAWSSPELLAKVSEVAGIDLEVSFEYEIANINISVGDQNTMTEQTDERPSDDEPPAFAWHYNSFAFVYVTVLSDCTGMIGEDTAIRMPSGEIRKIRGPAMGTAVVMQGRYLEHQALKALGGRERTSMVTAFRPKSHLVRDEMVLTGSRAISDMLFEERLRAKMKEERQRERSNRPFDIHAMKRFLEEQKALLEVTIMEPVEVEDRD